MCSWHADYAEIIIVITFLSLVITVLNVFVTFFAVEPIHTHDGSFAGRTLLWCNDALYTVYGSTPQGDGGDTHRLLGYDCSHSIHYNIRLLRQPAHRHRSCQVPQLSYIYRSPL